MEKNRLEIDTVKGYALWAKSYDYEKNPLIAVEEPYIEKFLNSVTVFNVLDAGAGTGRHSLKIAKRGIRVTAIDKSPEMLAVAKAKAQRFGLDINFHIVSIENQLPFVDEEFDLVLCSLVLTHIPNLANVVKEFYRVCSKGGYIFITDFHPDSLAQGWRTEYKTAETIYQLPNTQYTRENYLEAVCNAGFTLRQVKDIPTAEIPKGYVAEETIKTYADLGLCLFILGQK